MLHAIRHCKKYMYSSNQIKININHEIPLYTSYLLISTYLYLYDDLLSCLICDLTSDRKQMFSCQETVTCYKLHL
jgi:hypothetical protein